MRFFYVLKKVHWSDCDAAGIVWFPNYLGWFEDAEEEVFRSVLGRPRQGLLDEEKFGMPRVEVSIRFRAPLRAGEIVRIGIGSTLEHPRRLHHRFEMRHVDSGRLVADGFVRVACITLPDFAPRDLPAEVRRMVERLPDFAARQAAGEIEVPWS